MSSRSSIYANPGTIPIHCLTCRICPIRSGLLSRRCASSFRCCRHTMPHQKGHYYRYTGILGSCFLHVRRIPIPPLSADGNSCLSWHLACGGKSGSRSSSRFQQAGCHLSNMMDCCPLQPSIVLVSLRIYRYRNLTVILYV